MAMQNGRGAVIEGWDRFDSFHLYGVKPAAMLPTTEDDRLGHSLAGSATGSSLERNAAKPWHPDSPLFWFGALLATTLGLIGASTVVRVGPLKAGFSAGKT